MLATERNALRVLAICGVAGCSPATPTDGGADTSAADATPGGDTSAGIDTGARTDTGAQGDAAGGDAAAPVLHNCAPGDFVDNTAPSAEHFVHFHSPRYSPRCITILANQTVTFMGDAAVYPLRAGVAPSRAGDPEGTLLSPIPTRTSGELVEVLFTTPGSYPFYSPGNDERGMFGVVQVR